MKVLQLAGRSADLDHPLESVDIAALIVGNASMTVITVVIAAGPVQQSNFAAADRRDPQWRVD
jgi:hypothetical protein